MRVSTSHAALALVLTMSSLLPPSGQPAPLKPGETPRAGVSTVATWAFKRLAPPSPLYITRDDQLVCSVAASNAAEVVTVNYRVLQTFDGRIHYNQFTAKAVAGFAANTTTQPLDEGFLLSASCRAQFALTRGACFVRLSVGGGALGLTQPSYMLMADYVTQAMAPGFPGGRIISPTEGPGLLITILPNTPNPGSDWTTTVNVGTRVRIRAVKATFVTSAVVGNRIIYLEMFDNVGRRLLVVPPSILATAGKTWGLDGANGEPSSDPGNSEILWPLPNEVFMAGGYSIGPVTLGIDVSDQWSAIQLAAEQWFDDV